MLAKREIEYLAAAIRRTCPLVSAYNPETVREMKEAVKQWRRMVDEIAKSLETAQTTAKSTRKYRQYFVREQFLKDCGVEK